MRALSIRQPWAWLILHGGKDIENRVWPSSYQGPLLVHAAKSMTSYEYHDVADWLAVERNEIILPKREDIERGGIVGVVKMSGSVQSSASPWFFGPHGFVLSDAHAFAEPIPCKGQLGFFYVPDALVRTALAATPSTQQENSDG